jgi:excisionase family DNA binding protein
MRDDLLSSCANSTCTTPERSIAEAAHEAMQQSGVTTGGDVAAPCTDTPGIPAVSVQEPLPPPAPGTLPGAPCAPPWGVMQPAVQRLTPIGLSPLQAAAFLGTSRSRVYRLLREGRLLAVKQGIATIVTMESLTAYVKSLPPATFGSRLDEAAAA